MLLSSAEVVEHAWSHQLSSVAVKLPGSAFSSVARTKYEWDEHGAGSKMFLMLGVLPSRQSSQILTYLLLAAAWEAEGAEEFLALCS